MFTMPLPFTPDRLKHLQQSATERKLCWLVGCYLRDEQPQLFETLLDNAMAKPNAALASLLYSATYVKSRGRRRLAQRLDNTLHGVSNSEVEQALDSVEDDA